jgi:hypothetical protein
VELLIALVAFVLVDVLALRYGFDSRPSALSAHESAAIRGK